MLQGGGQLENDCDACLHGCVILQIIYLCRDSV
jgi:hypothetical protein